MRVALRRHATTIAVAMVTAAITAGGPAMAGVIADYARNAGKVDGRDAVGAKTSPSERAGVLVATNRFGRLPRDIIAKAPNAERIDGLDGRQLARRGTTQVSAPAMVWKSNSSADDVLSFDDYINEVRVRRSSPGHATLYAPMTIPTRTNGDPMKLTSVRFCYASGTQLIEWVRVDVTRQDEHGSLNHAGLAYPEATLIDDDAPQGSGCYELQVPEDRFNPPMILDETMSVTPMMSVEFVGDPSEIYLGGITATLEPVPGGVPPDRDTP